MTNGYRSKTFLRSVRQGCSIAPYLYLIQAEHFDASLRVRKNENLKGIQLPKLKDENMKWPGP
jgi:hypothetical protein